MLCLEQRVKEVEATCTEIFSIYERPVLLCSGGKDSLALLHMLRPWRHKVIVLHNKVDAGWPGVTENLEVLMNQWGFLRSVYCAPFFSQQQYVETFGWPVAVVPADLDGTIQPPSPYQEGALKLSSWWHCTVKRQIAPLGVAAAALKADAVLTGSRASDGPAFERMGMASSYPQWRRFNPLHTWSSNEIYQFIDQVGIPLPPHYRYKRELGDQWEYPDCVWCSWQPEHWALLRKHYPREYTRWWPQVEPVFDALKQTQRQFLARIEAAEAG